MALVNTSLSVRAVATQTSTLDLLTGQATLDYAAAIPLGNGTGANQGDRMFSDTRTLAASGAEDLDLAGTLLDPFGAAVTFARVKGLIIKAAAANTNSVVIGAAPANPWATLLGAAGTVTVRPGGILAVFAPDATAYAVTAGTADLLHVANSGAGTSVTYDIIIIGASA